MQSVLLGKLYPVMQEKKKEREMKRFQTSEKERKKERKENQLSNN
jgi:hypothetical protein